jgi:hypothetical protein
VKLNADDIGTGEWEYMPSVHDALVEWAWVGASLLLLKAWSSPYGVRCHIHSAQELQQVEPAWLALVEAVVEETGLVRGEETPWVGC